MMNSESVNTNNTELLSRAEEAVSYQKHGYNCAQAVAFAFRDYCDLDDEALFRITEGLGLGMGCMEGTCGAISAAAVLAGLFTSTADLTHPNSKPLTYQRVKPCIEAFKAQNGTITCRELKGIDTGRILRACPDCVRDAVGIIERELLPYAVQKKPRTAPAYEAPLAAKQDETV